MIRVLVADTSQKITENIVRRLEMENDITVCGTAADGERAVQDALRLVPDVAVLDTQLPSMTGLQATEMLAQYVPGAGVIMMSLDSANESYRSAMLAGAREFLPKPFKGTDLIAAIRRVHEFQQRKLAASAAAASHRADAAPGAPAPATTPLQGGQVIMVVSGKGGVGKSVVATNLAVLLARHHKNRVVLVDLSLQFGDVAALLDITTERTIADLAANDAVADREVVQDVLVDGPEGLKALLAPARPELADYVTTTHLRALMNELRQSFDLIVIDAPAYLNEITLDTVENADLVVMITDFSVTGVKNTRLALTVLDVLHVPPEKIAVVGNHRDDAGVVELERPQVESFLKAAIAAEIPFDPGVVGGSVSRGVPFVVTSPHSAPAAAIGNIARALGMEMGDGVVVAPVEPERRRKGRKLLAFSRN
jgi:pilus assembly protein CpaE